MLKVLLCVLLYPAPKDEPPEAVVGSWNVRWGTFHCAVAFDADGLWYYSDRKGNGSWWTERNGTVWMTHGTQLWVMKIDWKTRSGIGWLINGDGTKEIESVELSRRE